MPAVGEGGNGAWELRLRAVSRMEAQVLRCQARIVGGKSVGAVSSAADVVAAMFVVEVVVAMLALQVYWSSRRDQQVWGEMRMDGSCKISRSLKVY